MNLEASTASGLLGALSAILSIVSIRLARKMETVPDVRPEPYNKGIFRLNEIGQYNSEKAARDIELEAAERIELSNRRIAREAMGYGILAAIAAAVASAMSFIS